MSIIICDIEINGGLDWLFQNIFRATGKSRQMPFVLMITQMSPHNATKTKGTPATGFVLKPFTAGQLYIKIVEAAAV